MKATRNFSWTAFILSASFAACSSSPAPQPSPTSTAVACPAIELAPPQLAYPIPGATNVPTAAGELVFYGAVPSEFAGTLTANTSPALALGAFTTPPSPLPSPIATRGTQPNDQGALSGVPYPQLAAATTYTISFSEAGPCPMTVSDPSYTFTTE